MSKNNYKKINCKLCSRIFAQEKKFRQHLSDDHSLDVSSDESYENLYIEHELGGVEKLCKCGCGNRVKFNGWKRGYESDFVRGHNASKQGNFTNEEKIKKNVQKRLIGYKEGKYKVWNDGLTKENDARMKTLAEKTGKTLRRKYDSGELISWQVGLTKETDDRIARSVATRKQKGIKAWSKGKTKSTDERLAKLGNKISDYYKHNIDAGKRTKILDLRMIIDSIGLFTLEDDELLLYRNKYTMLPFKCVKCGAVQYKNITMLKNSPRCFSCNPDGSFAQREIFDFIKNELNIDDVSYNNRRVIPPKEIDIFVRSQNFAIEYNGLYWHSYAFLKNKVMHIDKFDSCLDNKIDLLTIYADEWKEKKEIYKNIIRDRLNLIERKSHILHNFVEMTHENCDQFLQENSPDCLSQYDIAFCMIFENDISCVATFKLENDFYVLTNIVKNPHYDDEIMYVLLQHCLTMKNIVVETNDRFIKSDKLISLGFKLVFERQQMWETNFVKRVEIFTENEKTLADSKSIIYGNLLKRFVYTT